MRTKQKTAPKKRPGKTIAGGRGTSTRRMILDAAAKVFAGHPYNAASIRMIAARGDFYHGLIRYHFPSKAAIFEAVVETACRLLYEGNRQWLAEISGLPPEEGFSLYLDRFIAFYRRRPEVLSIILQNLSHEDLLTLPGYRHLDAMLTDTRRDFENTFPGLFSGPDAGRYLSSLNALILHYLGAGTLEAQRLGFSPRSEAYLQWVKETLLFVFLPVLKKAAGEATVTENSGGENQ